MLWYVDRWSAYVLAVQALHVDIVHDVHVFILFPVHTSNRVSEHMGVQHHPHLHEVETCTSIYPPTAGNALFLLPPLPLLLHSFTIMMARPSRFLLPRLVALLLLLSLLLSHDTAARRITKPQPLVGEPQLELSATHSNHRFFKLARRWDAQRGDLRKRDMEVRCRPPHHVARPRHSHAREHSAEGSTSSRTSANSSARTAATRKSASSITWSSTIAASPMRPPYRSASWPGGS